MDNIANDLVKAFNEGYKQGKADAVKHGKWIPVVNGRGGYECSECHEYALFYQSRVECLSLFCPHCGSMMERE